jgi:hypothetical protein
MVIYRADGVFADTKMTLFNSRISNMYFTFIGFNAISKKEKAGKSGL